MLHIEVGWQLLAWASTKVFLCYIFDQNLHKFYRIGNEWKMRLNFLRASTGFRNENDEEAENARNNR
jgi:hypothetical protein